MLLTEIAILDELLQTHAGHFGRSTRTAAGTTEPAAVRPATFAAPG